MQSLVTIREAAKIKNVTPQAIYLAIRLKKLKAYRNNDELKIFRGDLDAYDNRRFSRDMAMENGKLIFDETKVSVERASEMLCIPKQKLYYSCRAGILKAHRIRKFWVINIDDLFKYEKEYLRKKKD